MKIRIGALVSFLTITSLASFPVALRAQPAPSSFKLAFWNVKSGKGQVALPGHPATFVDTPNCTDPTQPLNAWGVNLVQNELVAKVKNDPQIVALGLAEAWASVCGSPERVRAVLGWAARTNEQNGVAIVARYGFAGAAQWLQLDTSLAPNPSDTKWVVRTPVCLDATCTSALNVFTAHWSASNATADRQAQQTVAFMSALPATEPHVLMGDFNVWEGTQNVCSQSPLNTALGYLRNASYTDAWPRIHGAAEGYTGMTNRAGCGVPEGYSWKRIDYAWSKNIEPMSMTRFGVATPGDGAASDHYGIIVEYPWPGSSPVEDLTAPTVALTSPAANSTVAGTVDVAISANDDRSVARVDLLLDGLTIGSANTSPYQVALTTTAVVNGVHVLEARAYDGAGNTATSAPVSVTVNNTAGSEGSSGAGESEIVLYASRAAMVSGKWQRVADASAADGSRIDHPDAGAPKLTSPVANPADYFELTFTPVANVAYRLWLRGRAQNDSYNNDSVYVQFSGSVTDTGTPVNRIGTTQAAAVVLEDCSGCGVAGWGWQDNGYGLNVLGPLMYFTGGLQTIRIQGREDGISIDQIVLSSVKYLNKSPGSTRNDATILPNDATILPLPSTTGTVVRYPATAAILHGDWRIVADPTAAGGSRVEQPDAGAAKVTAPVANPANYFELTFTAEANRPYRLWLRGRAAADSYNNDSVYVQFSGSVTSSGTPINRIETAEAATVVLEDCSGCGVAGWGWQDNGYGRDVLGPVMYFTAGSQTMRIQGREDGISIDQIVLSPDSYLTTSPGATRNDATILTKTP